MRESTSIGGVYVGGSAELFINYVPIYNVGDIFYDRLEATRGHLDKIVIKDLIYPDNPIYGTAPYIIYRDTLNAIHFLEDLVTRDAAIEIIDSL